MTYQEVVRPDAVLVFSLLRLLESLILCDLATLAYLLSPSPGTGLPEVCGSEESRLD